MELIDKSTVVAEIERLKSVFVNERKKKKKGYHYSLNLFISFLDTLEVKEVDFETAFAASIDHFDEKNNYSQWSESDLRDFANHFFELGLKAQKGE